MSTIAVLGGFVNFYILSEGKVPNLSGCEEVGNPTQECPSKLDRMCGANPAPFPSDLRSKIRFDFR